MEAGKLRNRVTIESPTEARDALGGVTLTWATFAIVWASVSPIGGREYLQAAGTQAQVTHRVRCRRIAGVLPRMRVKHGTRTLHIEQVRDLEERRAELDLLCREEV